MSDKKSWKQMLGNFFKTTKSTVASTLNNINTHSIAVSKTCNTASPLTSEKPNFEGIGLIWYDPQIGTTGDTKLTAEELREINDRVIVYSDQMDCIKYVQTVQDEKIFLITSGKGAISILPEIQELKQVDSIFIFCFKIDKYRHLMQEYKSIVGIYDRRSTLINAIKENVRLLQRQLDVFNFYNKHKEKATRDLSKESAEFLWFQLLKDVLLQMPQNEQAKQELIDFSLEYYRENRKEREIIIEFKQSYTSKQSIHWYTKDSFLYRLVNKALRTEDVGQLQIFRFFISDLSSKLAEIHRKLQQNQKNIIMLYRGFQVETDEFERLKQNVGCIISTNGFLSVSRSKKVAIAFATRSSKRTNVIPILYEIECNLNISKSIIFADIAKYSKYPHEEEVLFDLGGTFQIESISEDNELKIIVVKLTVTDAGMKMAREYIELNRKMNEETTPDILFGTLLIQMGKYDQSLVYFQNLLNASHGKVDTARIHSAMGSAFLCKGELDEAHQHANRAYQMMIRTKPSRIKDSSRPMSVMGHIHLRREMYDEALDFYFEVLEIRKKFYGEQHLDTAVALNQIGNAYYEMQDYSRSFSFYENAFKIREKQLPRVHLDIAASLNNMGLVSWKGDEFNEEALGYFQESLNIRKQVLPLDHNDIIQSLHNIACLLYEMGDIESSLKYFTEACIIQKIEFDPNDHENLLNHLNEQYGLVPGAKLRKLGAWPVYADTCKHFSVQYDLNIEEMERINLQNQDMYILNDFLTTLNSDDDYSAALEAMITILKIPQNVINCPNYNRIEHLMKSFYDFVVDVYDRSDDSNKALHFYEKLQFILENTMSHWVNTDDIQSICLKRIGHINQLNGNYKSAVELLERSVKMNRSMQRTIVIEEVTNIGLIHMILGNYKLALTSFEKALELLQENPYEKDREIRCILKRIEQAKNAAEPGKNS